MLRVHYAQNLACRRVLDSCTFQFGPPPPNGSGKLLERTEGSTTTAQKIRFCTAPDGVRLAYATSGKGPPLVRVGHWMTHLERDWESPVWRPWLTELSRFNTLVRYDQRGSGMSDRNVPGISLEAWLADLETVVSATGLAPVDLPRPRKKGPDPAASPRPRSTS